MVEFKLNNQETLNKYFVIKVDDSCNNSKVSILPRYKNSDIVNYMSKYAKKFGNDEIINYSDFDGFYIEKQLPDFTLCYFADNEHIIFEFPDEETAFYFKLKFC